MADHSKVSIAALVVGITSVFFGWFPFVGLLLCIAAIILGIVGLVILKKNPALEGRGFAIAGLVMGMIMAILCILVSTFLVIAFFGIMTPSRFLPEKCDIGPGITCLDFNADGDPGEINILLGNNLGSTLTDIKLSITGCGDVDIQSLPIGESQQVNVPCPGLMSKAEQGRYRADILMVYKTYMENEQAVTHTKKGYIAVMVGE